MLEMLIKKNMMTQVVNSALKAGTYIRVYSGTDDSGYVRILF